MRSRTRTPGAVEPERLCHGVAHGGPSRLLASTVRSRVRILEHRGGGTARLHGAPVSRPPLRPGGTDMPGTHQRERGRPRLLLRLPREAGMIPSGERARRGAQDRLRCHPTLGPVTLGLPPLRAWRISLCPLARAARASGGGRTPRDAVLLCQGASAPLCLPPPSPASPGLRAEPGAGGAGKEARNIPGKR